MEKTYTRQKIVNMLNKLSFDLDQLGGDANKLAQDPDEKDEKEYFLGRRDAYFSACRWLEEKYLENYLDKD